MTLSGMTGFGRAEGAAGDRRWSFEARSVNGRSLDLKLRLPPGFEGMEPWIREAVAARFKRGSVQLTLAVKRDATRAGPRIDPAVLDGLIAQARPYLEAGLVAPPRWDGLLALRGVLTSGEEAAAGEEEGGGPGRSELDPGLEAALKAGLDAALAGLSAARLEEGANLRRIMGGLVSEIARLAASARDLAAAQPAQVLARLEARLGALTGDHGFDAQRLAQEAALIAARADVTEELDRLDAHAAEADALLRADGPVGRRIEFLTQELMREANTLGAKSNDLALTRASLDLKAAIDQLKEQAANVE